MMRQPYSVAIALRYLRSRSQSAFISFISAVSMLGIALAVGVLIIVMAVINGFETELEQRILSVSPDARLFGYADGAEAPLENWEELRLAALERDDILAATPFVEGPGLLNVGERLLAISVRGVDPALEPGVSSISQHIVSGSFAALADKWSIVIGQVLADELGVKVGDTVIVRRPEIRITAVGAINTMLEFTVAGTFDVGMAEFDRGLVLIGIDDASRLFRTRGQASGISLKVNDVFQASTIVREFGNAAADRFGGSYAYEDWSFRHANIFRSIALTKPVLFIVLSLVMAIAAFNIVSTLFMVVREKRGDIAILRSIGSAPRSILNIFIVQGSSIGFLGMLGGLAVGLLLVASLGSIVAWVESAFSVVVWSADVYGIGRLPTEARPAEIAQICAMAFGLAVLATLYPAYRASRLPPAEALRSE
jgi:lipoprotein-releasing system permease protein